MIVLMDLTNFIVIAFEKPSSDSRILFSKMTFWYTEFKKAHSFQENCPKIVWISNNKSQQEEILQKAKKIKEKGPEQKRQCPNSKEIPKKQRNDFVKEFDDLVGSGKMSKKSAGADENNVKSVLIMILYNCVNTTNWNTTQTRV